MINKGRQKIGPFCLFLYFIVLVLISMSDERCSASCMRDLIFFLFFFSLLHFQEYKENIYLGIMFLCSVLGIHKKIKLLQHCDLQTQQTKSPVYLYICTLSFLVFFPSAFNSYGQGNITYKLGFGYRSNPFAETRWHGQWDLPKESPCELNCIAPRPPLYLLTFLINFISGLIIYIDGFLLGNRAINTASGLISSRQKFSKKFGCGSAPLFLWKMSKPKLEKNLQKVQIQLPLSLKIARLSDYSGEVWI